MGSTSYKPRKYDEREKQAALELARQVGVKKAAEETGISVQSLHKWRSAEKGEPNTPIPINTSKIEQELLKIANNLESRLKYVDTQMGSLEIEREKIKDILQKLKVPTTEDLALR